MHVQTLLRHRYFLPRSDFELKDDGRFQQGSLAEAMLEAGSIDVEHREVEHYGLDFDLNCCCCSYSAKENRDATRRRHFATVIAGKLKRVRKATGEKEVSLCGVDS